MHLNVVYDGSDIELNSLDDGVGVIHDVHDTVSVNWEIPDYFEMSQKADTYFESPNFLISGSSVCFRIYPNGERQKRTVGCVGLYLRETDFKDHFVDTDVKIKLGIKDSDGRVFAFHTFSENFEGYSYLFGCENLIGRQELIREKRFLAPFGILTVFCVVTISSGLQVATQTPPLDYTDDLCNDFRTLYLDGKKSDVVFTFDEKELRAHKLILQARSPVFNAMFQNAWKEKNNGIVHITDCDSVTFHEFLLFLYTGKIENLTPDNFAGLYFLADKYQVKELKQRCIDFMNKNITVDTVCDIIAIADQHQEEKLKKSSEEFLVRNIKTILPTEKWKSFMTQNGDLAVQLLMEVIPGNSN